MGRISSRGAWKECVANTAVEGNPSQVCCCDEPVNCPKGGDCVRPIAASTTASSS